MTALAVPSEDLYDRWLDCVRAFGHGPLDGSGSWKIPGFAPDRPTFDALLALVRTESDPSSVLPDGSVHSDYFWVVDGAEMVGFVAVRHSIDTEFLRTLGGHIGYSVRPDRRRRGHASRALALALVRARELGLTSVLLTCDETNLASARTIESQGGRFEHAVEGKRRYWIALGPVAAAPT